MSTLEGFLIIYAVLAVGAPIAYVQIRRAARGESDRDRIVREAHERAAAAGQSDPTVLARAAGPGDPAWDARRERLWNAVHDDTNTAEGD